MKTEKQQQAYNLFFQTGMSQAEIVRLLEIDRKTLHNWMSEGNWRQLKKSAHHIPAKLAEQFYYMLANLNQEILGRAHQPYPLTHEVEQLRKMTMCIRNIKNRQTINESLESFTHLADILSIKDPELAAQLRPHIQSYVKDRADFKFADAISEEYQCDPALGEMFDYEMRPFDDSEPDTPPGSAPITPEPPSPTVPLKALEAIEVVA